MSVRLPFPPIRTIEFGFLVHRAFQETMDYADQHNEIEINFIEQGEMTLRRGGESLIVPQGTFLVYWAAIPHQVVAVKPRTRINWCIIPVSWFLAWELAMPFRSRILSGEALSYSARGKGRPVPPFANWAEDFASRSEERRRIVQLEIEAFLRRLALEQIAPRQLDRSNPLASPVQCSHVEKMAAFMIQHFREPLAVAQIASSAGLNAEYAMRLFQKHWKLTIGNFLLQQRLAEAKRRLLSDDEDLTTIAFASGFQSLSRFYAVFQRECGCSPGMYRRRLTE